MRDAGTAARQKDRERSMSAHLFRQIGLRPDGISAGAQFYVSWGVLFAGQKYGFLGGGCCAVKHFEQLRP